jgi:hypothetical protein
MAGSIPKFGWAPPETLINRDINRMKTPITSPNKNDV